MKTLLTTTAAILLMTTTAMADPVTLEDLLSGKRVAVGVDADDCPSELAKAKPIADRTDADTASQVFVLPDGTYRSFSSIRNGRGEVMGPEMTFIIYDNCDVQLMTQPQS